jgi:mono/diheme cytochrome c family protein
VLEGRQQPGRTMAMPAWKGVLKNDDIYKIGAYLETMAIDGANWKEGNKH